MKLSGPLQKLVDAAVAVLPHSHSPYSQFRVAAAVQTDDGRVFTGVNIENASYGGTICAERVAVTKAISEGSKRITAISVVTETEAPCSPCGLCRQVLVEFCDDDCKVVCATTSGKSKISSLGDLTPDFFRADQLSNSKTAKA